MQNDLTPLERILAITARLRDPINGCEWDRAQSFASIAPYTIEEAYEVSDAIERNDHAALCDELGDLLFQVTLHAQIAADQGLFTIDDVATAIADKMERRHPHIFGNAVARPNWDEIKDAERPSEHGALSGIAHALPALMRAEKLQKRAARTGFDWPNAEGPRSKIDEELSEITEANCKAARHEEVGDLLFAVVNYARHLGVDAEHALRDANAKFERRFIAMEAHAGDQFPGLSLEEKEALWQQVKTGF